MDVRGLPQPSRYTAFILCVVGWALASLAAWVGMQWRWHWLWIFAGLFAALVILGLLDLLQSRHSIRRNYPVIGHIRWLAEMIRPEIRQYLIESDSDAAPRCLPRIPPASMWLVT